MSYNRFGELVHETSTTTGTGNKTLSVTGAGNQRISGIFGTGDNGEFNPIVTFRHRSANEWERVQGYMSDANTFVPVTVIESSNSNAAVSFSAGTKDVTVGYPASQAYRPDQDLFDGLALCRLAKLDGRAQFCGDRFGDSFGTDSSANMTYVDTASSTNEDTGTAGLVKPTTGAATNVATVATPTLSSSGAVQNETLFNDGTTSGQASGTNAGQSSVAFRLDFGAGNEKAASSYSYFGGSSGASACPSAWTLKGSNTSFASMTTLDTQSGQSGVADGVEKGPYSFSNTTAYRYWEFATTARNGGSETRIAEFKLFTPGTPNNMTLLSAGVTPINNTSKVILVARVKHVDSATAGTDYNFTVSRNGGSAFSSNLTLHDRFTDPTDSCHVIESDPIDVSGQTSPSTVVLKMVTANNKSVELRDWYFRAIP